MKLACLRLALAVALAVCSSAYAADRACTKADGTAAAKVIDQVVSWGQLRKTWESYRHCDEGETADLYTEALMRLIVDWKKIEDLSAAIEKDPDYRQFVVRHLQSPAAKDDANTIYLRAKQNCPKDQQPFCDDIISIVKPGAAKPVTPAAAPAPAPPSTPPK